MLHARAGVVIVFSLSTKTQFVKKSRTLKINRESCPSRQSISYLLLITSGLLEVTFIELFFKLGQTGTNNKLEQNWNKTVAIP